METTKRLHLNDLMIQNMRCRLHTMSGNVLRHLITPNMGTYQ